MNNTSKSDYKSSSEESREPSRFKKCVKQLFCGGIAGSVAKTVTAPLSRVTILFQVHSMVTRKEHRPRFAMTSTGGIKKIIERGGILSLWKGNLPSVMHRFPFSAINFYCYENILDALTNNRNERNGVDGNSSISSTSRFAAGASAGSIAVCACYPLDLIRTRITTEFPGREHYKGIYDAFSKIIKAEGIAGLYSGLKPTLFVAVPNFAISYTAYGTLKEYCLEDELFYNFRKVDDSGTKKLGFISTILCGALSGSLSTIVTFPFDTIRRRSQIQNLHIPVEERLTASQQFFSVTQKEGVRGLYRGLTPELMKVVPMVGTMFLVYEFLKSKENLL